MPAAAAIIYIIFLHGITIKMNEQLKDELEPIAKSVVLFFELRHIARQRHFLSGSSKSTLVLWAGARHGTLCLVYGRVK